MTSYNKHLGHGVDLLTVDLLICDLSKLKDVSCLMALDLRVCGLVKVPQICQ